MLRLNTFLDCLCACSLVLGWLVVLSMVVLGYVVTCDRIDLRELLNQSADMAVSIALMYISTTLLIAYSSMARCVLCAVLLCAVPHLFAAAPYGPGSADSSFSLASSTSYPRNGILTVAFMSNEFTMSRVYPQPVCVARDSILDACTASSQ